LRDATHRDRRRMFACLGRGERHRR
jgi:hypothetical protein